MISSHESYVIHVMKFFLITFTLSSFCSMFSIKMRIGVNI